MIDRISAFEEVPTSYKQRIHTNFDPVAGRPFLDMRMLLAARLLRLNTSGEVIRWLADRTTAIAKSDLSLFDRRLLDGLRR